ncbi:MAG TPA: dethiobiotin synthase [Polyangiaceae bacterium]|nr:dethiobiotin synthase [Polyangiaceae bacterium]
MSPRRLIVLGTGTDVGKTHVGSVVLSALSAQGVAVLGLKPVESGIDPGTEWASTDAGRLGAATGRLVKPLHGLVPPISPHLAARQIGLALELDELEHWIEAQEAGPTQEGLTKPELSWIETAGGAFSPLSERATNWDLALRLARPGDRLLLIAPDALGTLHDCTATLLAMVGSGRLPDAILFSQARPLDASSGTNAEELARLVLPRPELQRSGCARPALLGTLRRGGHPSDCDEIMRWLGEWLGV